MASKTASSADLILQAQVDDYRLYRISTCGCHILTANSLGDGTEYVSVNLVGYGKTKQDALKNLMRLISGALACQKRIAEVIDHAKKTKTQAKSKAESVPDLLF